MSEEFRDGMNRRDVLRRGAMVGGALVWTAPAVQSLAGPALAAQGSVAPELCGFVLILDPDNGPAGCVRISATTVACCDELNKANAIADPADRFAAMLAALGGQECAGVGTISNCPTD